MSLALACLASLALSAELPSPPQAALNDLKEGNAHFVAGKRVRTSNPSDDAALRKQLASGQAPFAVILGCSDSRVPESFVFDQEPGRLFVVREAGNTADLQALASTEYGVLALGARVIVVLGHTSCGAVKAVKEAKGKPLSGNFWVFQAGMAGLLETTPPGEKESEVAYLTRLSAENARRQAQAIVDRSPALREKVATGALIVVPAVYDLSSGEVTFHEPIPAR
jgi:carbonic anhydrase